MSASATFVVRLDPVPLEEAERIAADVVTWLALSGHAGAPDPTGRALFPLTEGDAPQWCAGPALRALDPGRGSWEHVRVLVSARRQICHAVELWEPARCGGCGTPLEPDADSGALAVWYDDAEPTLTCSACGWSAPYGDWPSTGACAVGAPVIGVDTFLDERGDAFLQECRERLGGRSRTVFSRL